MVIPENSGWNKRVYHFYLIFGEIINGKEPWFEEEWSNNFQPLFDKIIQISLNSKDTGLRVLEYKKINETDKYYKEYKLGKLRWDEKSHNKWTLKNNDPRLFAHFESWTPLWTICEKNNLSPDIYFSISNEANIYESRQFDTLVTLAISDDIGKIPMELILKLSKIFNSKKTVYNKRKWGEGKKDDMRKWYFINSILDSDSLGIYKDKDIKNLNIHTIDFNKIVFEPYWEIIK
jgi:hypothetical protein